MRPETPNATAADPAEAPAEAKSPGPKSTIPAIEPAILRRRDAAHLCGVSEGSWSRHHAAGRVPDPVRIGGCVGWRRQELLDWIAAGCPDRRSWETVKEAKDRRPGR